MDLPSFNGQLQIKEFLDRIAELERFFDYMEIQKHRKMKLVALHLEGNTFAWWDQVIINCTEQQRKPVRR